MKKLLMTSMAAAMLMGGAAYAETHEVKMLNRGEAGSMVFEPEILHIAPGDTVTFVATDRSHNAETIEGMIPEGAEGFVGDMHADVTATFDQEGVYGIKCKPHYGLGMISTIVVGEPTNLEEAQAVKHPGKAKAKFAAQLDGLAG